MRSTKNVRVWSANSADIPAFFPIGSNWKAVIARILSLLIVPALLLFSTASQTAATPPPAHLRPAIVVSPLFTPQGEDCKLLLQSHLPLADYSSFLLTSSNLLVIDVHQADFLGNPPAMMETSCADFPEVRLAQHADKIRIVFNVAGKKEVLPQIEQVAGGLQIILPGQATKDRPLNQSGPTVLPQETVTVSETIIPHAVKRVSVIKPPVKSATTTVQSEPKAKPSENDGQPTKQLLETRFSTQPITLSLFKSDLNEFFAQVAASSGRIILLDPAINAPLTLNFRETPLAQAVQAVLTIYKLRLEERENQIYVYRRDDS